MPRVRKTVLAEQDLEEIWLYIAADNIVAADAHIDKLVEKSALLAANTELGRARPELHEGLRSFRSAITSCFIAPKPEVSSLHACCTVPVTSMPYCFRRLDEMRLAQSARLKWHGSSMERIEPASDQA